MEVIERKMLLIALQKIFIGIKQSIYTAICDIWQEFCQKNSISTIFSITALYLSVSKRTKD